MTTPDRATPASIFRSAAEAYKGRSPGRQEQALFNYIVAAAVNKKRIFYASQVSPDISKPPHGTLHEMECVWSEKAPEGTNRLMAFILLWNVFETGSRRCPDVCRVRKRGCIARQAVQRNEGVQT